MKILLVKKNTRSWSIRIGMKKNQTLVQGVSVSNEALPKMYNKILVFVFNILSFAL